MALTSPKKKKAFQKASKPARKTAQRVIVSSYERHIEVTPDIREGKPRIAVEDIVSMHLNHGQSVQHIVDSYGLSPTQIYAALTFYYDHRNEIDQSLAEGVARYEAEKASHPSLVVRKLAVRSSSPHDSDH